MKLSAKGGQAKSLEDSLAEAICFIVLEKGYDLGRLRKLDFPSFMVLLQFLEKQAREQAKQNKALAKKSKKR